MPPRLAACDPCRSAKIACDHGRPVCSGCQAAERESRCTYRERPFKRARTAWTQRQSTLSPSSTNAPSGTTQMPSANYPNPGYLGSSSSTTIFNHLLPDNDHERDDREPLRAPVANVHVLRGANLIQQAYSSMDVSSCRRLVEAWIAKGVNLALAGSFTNQCTQTADGILSSMVAVTAEAREVSRDLFNLSACPLTTVVTGTVEDFASHFCHDNARWETLGLFFTAVSRAAVDIATFEPLYSTSQGQRTFQSLAIQFSDQCLDFALMLDNMNDLQLVLQYENFIAHSFVDGDQSEWRSFASCGPSTSNNHRLPFMEKVG